MNYKYCYKLISFILFLLMVSSSGFSETIKLELSEKKIWHFKRSS